MLAIGRDGPLPVERLAAGLPQCHADLSAAHWASAAEAIMTTDTVPKAFSTRAQVGGKTITVTGNQPPIVNAGSDRVLDLIAANGGATNSTTGSSRLPEMSPPCPCAIAMRAGSALLISNETIAATASEA